jgi:LuxR family transcriptional regulator, maltose regulon positive regulatory protein
LVEEGADMEWDNSDQLLLTTKLTVPPIYHHRVIPRQRLYWQLDSGVQHPILLISAPMGFGKTTAVAEWLQQKVISVAWVSLEKADNDLMRFWRYVITALCRQYDAVCKYIETWQTVSIGNVMPSQPSVQNLHTSSIDIEALLTALINALLNFSENMVLVLDDYQEIQDVAIHQSMAFLLEHLPPQLHLIILTRSDPPLAITRLRVQGKLTEIRAIDLCLTVDEARTFLNEVMHLSLAEQQIEDLCQRTEGWIAGIQLALLSLHGCDDTTSIQHFINTFTCIDKYILRYLSEEVLYNQSEDVQTFLLLTSILERLTPSLCNAITSRSDSQEILERLEQANLFLFLLDEQEHQYRYHRLFADVLRYQLHQQHPEQEAELHFRASVWYEQHGMIHAAIDHALLAGALERSADLLENAAWSLLQEKEYTIICSWLTQIPKQIFHKRPALSYMYACVSINLARMEEYEYYAQQAEEIWQKEHNIPMLGRVYDLHSYAAQLRDDPLTTRQYAQQALDLATISDFHLRASALVNLGAAHLQLGQLMEARIAYEAGAELSQEEESLQVQLHASLLRGYAASLQGDLSTSAQIYSQMLREVEAGFTPWSGTSPHSNYIWYAIIVHLGLTTIYQEWNDLAQCIEHWQQAAHLIEQSEIKDLAFWRYFRLGAQLAWYRGEYDQVMNWLDQAEQSAQHFGENRTAYAEIIEFRVQFLLASNNNVSVAHSYLENAQTIFKPSDVTFPYEKEAYILAQARLLIAQKLPEAAITLLEDLLPTVHAQGRISREIVILLLLTLAYNAEGSTQQTLQTLERALMLGENGNYIRTFVDEGPSLSVLLNELYHRYQKRANSDTSTIGMTYLYQLFNALVQHPYIEQSNEEKHVSLFISTYRDSSIKKIPKKSGENAPGREIPPSWSREQEREVSLIETLSEREDTVLRLIGEGLSNQEIARTLVVTVSTVKTHLNNIYAKLHVHTRLQAVTKAYDLGLLSRGEVETEPLTHPDLSNKQL